MTGPPPASPRMPLQYILGEWDFHCLTLKMVPPVFIPRPETEQLVELALARLRGLEAPRVLEIGCGSGAISLALLHALPQVGAWQIFILKPHQDVKL